MSTVQEFTTFGRDMSQAQEQTKFGLIPGPGMDYVWTRYLIPGIECVN